MIELRGLTKRYGPSTVVDGLTFAVVPGRVTGFLGPNGAGKSTTMRMILGLDHPSAGTALVNGVPYRELPEPIRHVGALLEANALHPGRRAHAHLRVAARTHGLRSSRVDEVIDQVGLTSVAGKRISTFSLGMRQRLGIAAALLGDPEVIVMDEPGNGLDAEGVRWVRGLLRSLAAEGRTVFVSSHLMSEMQQTADHLLVIGRGRLIADASTAEVLTRNSARSVRVRTPEPDRLMRHLGQAASTTLQRLDDNGFIVKGADLQEVGAAAFAAGVPVYELTEVQSSLEQAFLELTAGSLEYAGTKKGEA